MHAQVNGPHPYTGTGTWSYHLLTMHGRVLPEDRRSCDACCLSARGLLLSLTAPCFPLLSPLNRDTSSRPLQSWLITWLIYLRAAHGMAAIPSSRPRCVVKECLGDVSPAPSLSAVCRLPGLFEISVATPPPRSLGIYALPPLTHNGEEIEVVSA